MVEVFILVALAYIGYQLKRLIGFIEARMAPTVPSPSRWAQIKPYLAPRILIPRLYGWVWIVFMIAWALRIISSGSH